MKRGCSAIHIYFKSSHDQGSTLNPISKAGLHVHDIHLDKSLKFSKLTQNALIFLLAEYGLEFAFEIKLRFYQMFNINNKKTL